MAVSPFLIFGWGVPAMGIAGSAAGFAIAQVVGVGMTMYALIGPHSRFKLKLRNPKPDWPMLWRMVRLGAPASVTSGERSLAQLLLIGIVAPFGDFPIAAYAVIQRLQSFVNLAQDGVAQAAGVLANQNIGAGRVDRARTTVHWAIGYTAMMTTILGVTLFFFPEPVLRIFTRDEGLVAAAVPWVRIMTMGFLFMGIGDVLMYVMNTSGDTLVPMAISLSTVWLVQQPLALVLSGRTASWAPFGLDLPTVEGLADLGVAWAMVLALVVRLCLYLPYFKIGRAHV